MFLLMRPDYGQAAEDIKSLGWERPCGLGYFLHRFDQGSASLAIKIRHNDVDYETRYQKALAALIKFYSKANTLHIFWKPIYNFWLELCKHMPNIEGKTVYLYSTKFYHGDVSQDTLDYELKDSIAKLNTAAKIYYVGEEIIPEHEMLKNAFTNLKNIVVHRNYGKFYCILFVQVESNNYSALTRSNYFI